ncbi:unnamed protein product, partial [Cladocopium goreaui]
NLLKHQGAAVDHHPLLQTLLSELLFSAGGVCYCARRSQRLLCRLLVAKQGLKARNHGTTARIGKAPDNTGERHGQVTQMGKGIAVEDQGQRILYQERHGQVTQMGKGIAVEDQGQRILYQERHGQVTQMGKGIAVEDQGQRILYQERHGQVTQMGKGIAVEDQGQRILYQVGSAQFPTVKRSQGPVFFQMTLVAFPCAPGNLLKHQAAAVDGALLQTLLSEKSDG